MSTSDLPTVAVPEADILQRFWHQKGQLMAVAELDGRFDMVSPGWTEALGWSQEDLATMDWRECVHPDDRARTIEVAILVHDGGKHDLLEHRFRHRDGGYRWLRHRSPVILDDGRALLLAHDVTAEKQAQEQVAATLVAQEAMQRELLRSNEELSRFAHVASHDLHEPLRKVRSFCTLLARDYGEVIDERGQRYITAAVSGAERMQKLLDALLAYSRAGSNQSFGPVDLGKVAADAVADVGILVAERGATIEVGDLPTAWGDEVLLTQLFQNLISNAVKYAADGRAPRIEVVGATDGDRCMIEVRDNGIGIPPDRLEDVFELFTRLHSREEEPGTGIGLATCRRIVDAHGGRILATSTTGEGTTFSITLPAGAATATDVDGDRKDES